MRKLLPLLLAAAIAGCGNDSNQNSSTSSGGIAPPVSDSDAPTFRFNEGGRDYPVACAPDNATAQHWCDRAQEGEYADDLDDATQIQFLLPDSNGSDLTCVLG